MPWLAPIGTTPATLTNLVTNPSFEVGTTAGYATSGDFIGGGSVTVTVDTNPAVGSKACQIVSTANSNGIAYDVALTAGTYYISAYIRRDAGSIGVEFKVGEEFGAFNAYTVSSSVTSASYVRVGAAITIANTGTHRLYWRIPGGQGTWHIDGVSVVRTGTDPGYFDGDTAGYSWTGTSQASTSNNAGALPVPSIRPVSPASMRAPF